jgi:anthranilate phosphoribosyltransferase
MRLPAHRAGDITVTDPTADAIRSALRLVAAGESMSADQAEAFMQAVLDGAVTPAQLGGLLVGLRVRGANAAELAGFVRAMRSRALPVAAPEGTIDTCGTGGDVRGTFNISTAAAIVVAAAGVPVAKAGNRAVSSRAGSSDVMAALGLRVELSPQEAEASLHKDSFAYLHAPAFHPGMRHAGPVRMELGVSTAFNLIGPLANPAQPRRQLVGVPDEHAAASVADVLLELGTERAFVVRGERLDELPLDGSGVVFEVTPDGVQRRAVAPADHGLAEASSDALAGGDGATNARLISDILERRAQGPRHDVVVLNAGASLLVAGRVESLRHGVALAAETIASGAAGDRLARLREAAGPPSHAQAAVRTHVRSEDPVA